MGLSSDLGEAKAGLELLLADATPASAPMLRDKIIEFARILQPAYRKNGEWDELVGRIRARFEMDVPDEFVVAGKLHAVPVAFETPATFDEIIEGGWFGEYLEYTAESEAPAQFHFGSMLACASAAFGRQPLIGWEAAPLYPNIYALLIGPTGTRKSSALAKAREIVQAAFPKVAGKAPRVNVLPNEGSPQGYASALRNRCFETGAVSDGLIIASELTVLVGREQYKLALGSWLTDWYDNMAPTWSRALKGESVYELQAPYVCFVGASNMTWLREIPEQLIKAGYMPRHLVFTATGKRHDRANPQFDGRRRARLVKKLAARFEDIPAEIPLSPAAVALMDEWYMRKVTWQERVEVDELFAAWLARKLPHALKTACVWQFVDGGPKDAVHVDWMRRAMRLVDWMDAGVMAVYRALGSTTEGAVADAVFDWITRKGGEATLSALARGLKNRYNKQSVLMGVQTLVLARMLMSEQDAVVGTRLIVVKGAGG